MPPLAIGASWSEPPLLLLELPGLEKDSLGEGMLADWPVAASNVSNPSSSSSASAPVSIAALHGQQLEQVGGPG